MPRTIAVLGTGGTIASTGDEEKVAAVSIDDLLEEAPALEGVADVRVEDCFRINSSDVDFDRLWTLAAAIEERAEWADAVVVTHGTDTMEETAAFLDLVVDGIPIVLTGAQRPADAVAPDGPRNLLDAIRVAADERVTEGVYVAFAGVVHAARFVRKAETAATDPFESHPRGALGRVADDGLEITQDLRSYSPSVPTAPASPTIPIVYSAVGVGPAQITAAVDRGVDGIVLVGNGVGNTAAAVGDAAVDALTAGHPVVLTSRCCRGPVRPIYGGPGGGKRLAEAGVLLAGDRTPQRARIELAVGVARTDGLGPGALFD